MLQRGTIVQVDGLGRALVLTKTSWNLAMHGVGVVPAVPRATASPTATIDPWDDQEAFDPTRIVVVPQRAAQEIVAVATDTLLHSIERGLAELVQARRLLNTPPKLARPPAGRVDYPRWGDIYYINAAATTERKRYVVVSFDEWNAAHKTALVVRLTSRQKQSDAQFPAVADGTSRACCGEVTAVSAAAIDQRARPHDTVSRLNLNDMVAIARGIPATHLLRDYLTESELLAAE